MTVILRDAPADISLDRLMAVQPFFVFFQLISFLDMHTNIFVDIYTNAINIRISLSACKKVILVILTVKDCKNAMLKSS